MLDILISRVLNKLIFLNPTIDKHELINIFVIRLLFFIIIQILMCIKLIYFAVMVITELAQVIKNISSH